MAKRWLLRGVATTHAIATWAELDARGLAQAGAPGLDGLIEQWARDPMTRVALVEMLREIGVNASLPRVDLVAAVRLAFRQRLLGVISQAPALVYVAPPRVEPIEPAEPDDPEPLRRDERDWIEIELVDSADQPVRRARYRVELPDGSTREGMLNNQGFARIEGIDPGTCKVTFPAIDGREWAPA